MARPNKHTVDYFPHMVAHGKTMFILEERYGNDGYAAWFKILEALGSTEGHFINCSNGRSEWEFLQAKTRLSGDMLLSILDLLAKLDAIDAELWVSARIIWCQKFVDGVDEVYRRRKINKPLPPTITPTQRSKCQQKPSSASDNADKKPQSRESRESRELKAASPASFSISKLADRINEQCRKINALPKRKERFVPNQWAVWASNHGYHPEAISHVLDQLIKLWPEIKTPWSYACKIIKVESGNFYEQEKAKGIQKEKLDFADLVNRLQEVHKDTAKDGLPYEAPD